VNLSKRLRSLLILLFSASVLLTLVLLFSVDRGSFAQLQELTDRLSKSDKEREQAGISERVLGPLGLMAGQVAERRDDLIEGVQQLATDGALRALYASAHPEAGSTKASPGAKPETLQQILTRWATMKKSVWSSAELTDRSGHVLASWPANSGKGQDLSKESVFVQLSAAGAPLGISDLDFAKKNEKNSQGPVEGQLVLSCGIEGADGNFSGALRVKAPVDKLLGLRLDNFLKPIRAVSPKAVVILMRGSGEQVFHSSKGSYAENFDRMGQEFKSAMAATQAQGEGRLAISSYEGKPGLLVWKRVGAWQPGAGISSLLTLATLLPEGDFKPVASDTKLGKPAPFWARPVPLLLLLLAFAAPLGLGLLLFGRATQPLSRLVEVASQIDEQGFVPEGLEFHQEADPEINRVNLGLNALASLSRTATGRLHELDGALSRAEEQASHDATRAAQELADMRSKLAAAEAEKTASQAALAAAQRDADSQSSVLKNSLETAQRDAASKNSENKNLLAQVQDLTRALEEKAKAPALVAPVAQSASQREDELVRLSAVNTLSGELKATLLVIKNYVSSMLGSSGAISDQQQEFLGVVINKSARLERLIGDLVELSEISFGIKPPHLEKVRLSSILEEGLLGIRPQADQKNITLELTGQDNGAEVSVDKDKFGGIIRALIGQAIKVTSRSERVTILVSGDKSHSEIRITDPGMSLTADRAAKVFNQFHGVDSQAGPEFIGTGLRFSIMRAIVEAHGGRIWIESQPGRGKSFVISLPVAGSLAPLAALPVPNPPALAVPKAVLKPSPAEFAGFNSIFGEMPAASALPSLPSLAPPPPSSSPLPKVELKTEAAKAPLAEKDMANFAAIFGTPAPPKVLGPPPAPGAVPAPPPKPIPADLAKFDAIFGTPAPPPKPASGPSGMDDLNNMFK
jgi:nitrogen-specific signal transduction histidine kinase